MFKVTVFVLPHQHLVLSDFFMLAILMGIKPCFLYLRLLFLVRICKYLDNPNKLLSSILQIRRQ